MPPSLAFILVAAATAPIGWWALFGQFQRYDDQGYLMITVRHFLAGHALYDEVFTQYGPAYYLWTWLLHAAGLPLAHDAVRLATLAVWLGVALLAGLAVHAATRRLVLALLVQLLVFLHLLKLAYEPGHPQELGALAVAGFVALAARTLARESDVSDGAAAGLGVLVAVAALTKVNVGAYLGVGGACALLALARPGTARRALAVLAAGAALALPAVVLRAHLDEPWAREYALLATCSTAAVLLTAFGAPAPSRVGTRQLAMAAGAALATALGIAGAVLLRGTSVAGLVAGVLLRPAALPAVFWSPTPLAAGVGAAAFAGLVLAAACRWHARTARLVPALQLVAGTGTLVLSSLGEHGLLLAFGTPFLWLSCVPGGAPALRPAAIVVALVAALQSLQAYPMPGTQTALATFLLVPAAALSLAAVFEGLRARSPERFARPAVSRALGVAGLVVLVLLVAGRGAELRALHARGVPLGVPGTTRIRASERDAATYGWLVANLDAHCDSFYSSPGLNSLHFWTGIPAPTTLNTTLWSILLDHEEQRRVVAALAEHERACIVVEPRMGGPFARGGPLERYIAENFEPRATVGRFRFLVRRGRAPVEPRASARRLGDHALLEVGPLGKRKIDRLAVVNLDTGALLADTAASGRLGLAIADESGAPVDPSAGGIDVSRVRRLTIAPGGGLALGPDAFVVVRLFSGGTWVASLPFVTDRLADRPQDPFPPPRPHGAPPDLP